MNKNEMNDRTKKWAIDVILLVKTLPYAEEYKIIKNQIIKSATSVGANYRASNRAKSTADIINKRKIVEEEADETLYWLEIIVALESNKRNEIVPLYKEGDEILSIIVASIKKLKTQI
jgi:four helix bundle protein